MQYSNSMCNSSIKIHSSMKIYVWYFVIYRLIIINIIRLKIKMLVIVLALNACRMRKISVTLNFYFFPSTKFTKRNSYCEFYIFLSQECNINWRLLLGTLFASLTRNYHVIYVSMLHQNNLDLWKFKLLREFLNRKSKT